MGNLRVGKTLANWFHLYPTWPFGHLRETAGFLLGGEDRLFVFTSSWYSSRKAMRPMTRLG